MKAWILLVVFLFGCTDFSLNGMATANLGLNEPQRIVATCDDNDGGMNQNEFGYVRGVDSEGRYFDFADACGPGVLSEQYCEGKEAMSKVIQCECENGKCV